MMIDLLSISLTEEAGRGAGGPGGRERRGKVETSLDNQNRKFDSYRTRNEKATTIVLIRNDFSNFVRFYFVTFELAHEIVPNLGTRGGYVRYYHSVQNQSATL